jgi:hypothetical protein
MFRSGWVLRFRVAQIANHAISSLPSAEAAGGMSADLADLVGKLDALLGKFFPTAMLEAAGKCRFVWFVFHAGLLLQKHSKQMVSERL